MRQGKRKKRKKEGGTSSNNAVGEQRGWRFFAKEKPGKKKEGGITDLPCLRKLKKKKGGVSRQRQQERSQPCGKLRAKMTVDTSIGKGEDESFKMAWSGERGATLARCKFQGKRKRIKLGAGGEKKGKKKPTNVCIGLSAPEGKTFRLLHAIISLKKEADYVSVSRS